MNCKLEQKQQKGKEQKRKCTLRKTRLGGKTRQQSKEVKEMLRKKKRSIKQIREKSTEGNTYNHANERVDKVDGLREEFEEGCLDDWRR